MITFLFLFFLDRRRPVVTTPASVKKSKVALYAAVSSAVLLLFTVIIAAVCLRRYHRRRRGKKTEFDFLTTMTSIRDRIREESQVNPLLEMLANSKPGDLIQYPLDCVEYIQDLGEGTVRQSLPRYVVVTTIFCPQS